MPFALEDFVAESNRIEGVQGFTHSNVDAHRIFLARTDIGITDVQRFVSEIAPGMPLRDRLGMNVRVGSYLAPAGGPSIRVKLEELLNAANRGDRRENAYRVHLDYERLHPFMDGNGRSGRVIWLWMMGGIEKAPLGFLHHFYYQTLAAGDPPRGVLAP